jgi:dihydroflavonol-4-reductase
LITGATGFIGNHVTRMCLEQGDKVRVMVMPGEDRSPLDGLDVEFVEGNLLDPASLTPAVQGIEQLYHLAALFAIWTRDPDLHYKINVNGAEAILRAAMDAGVQKVVYTSSIAAIGINGDGTPANEETRFNCWPWASEYILSKYISHQMVKGLVSEGLPATLVLPGLPFGPGDRAPTPTGSMIVRTLQGKMKNYWDGGVCPVDVRDVARGHVLAMAKGRIGESYLLANREANMSNKEFLDLIGRVAGVDNVAKNKVSSDVMLRVARLAEWWSKITGKAPMTTYKNTLFVQQYCYVDPGKAIGELGLPQTPIEDAVRDSVAWFRENGYA